MVTSKGRNTKKSMQILFEVDFEEYDQYLFKKSYERDKESDQKWSFKEQLNL